MPKTSTPPPMRVSEMPEATAGIDQRRYDDDDGTDWAAYEVAAATPQWLAQTGDMLWASRPACGHWDADPLPGDLVIYDRGEGILIAGHWRRVGKLDGRLVAIVQACVRAVAPIGADGRPGLAGVR